MIKKFSFDWNEYESLARKIGAEGCVLLKNDNSVLPLKGGKKVAVFGRMQFDYIKCGTGSGGMVNVPYVVNIYEGLKNSTEIIVDEKIADIYREWLEIHPFDKGSGWAKEPFSQLEMPVDEILAAEAAKNNDAAIVVIGRLSGEDRDNNKEPGSYCLKEDEINLLKVVCKFFEKVAVLINSGNIIDMKWVEEINPGAVLYVWQGGIEGGNSVADLITGVTSPSGRLSDTIAYNIEDYPCEGNFGDPLQAIYVEDIFVGYRYFETFAKEKVMYPFGFGLSYTEFSHSGHKLLWNGDAFSDVTVSLVVKNLGEYASKEVSQVYFKAPDGKLCKPARELVAFEKTGELAPKEECSLEICFSFADMASYDDTGRTGFENSFVLEAGEYEIYEGANVRDAVLVGKLELQKTVQVEQTSDACAPITPFKRMVKASDGSIAWEDTPLRKYAPMDHIIEERNNLKELEYAGSQKYNLKDVYDKKIDLDTFVAGLSDKEMIAMTRGEGTCSARVTPGTTAGYAGVTDALESYGIPAVCNADGPSGIRMDVGTLAMQGPNGVSLACTFNKAGVEEFYAYVGRELRLNKIDSLLGPGMNIHRSPLNGRNFEYFSEDPILTGKMAAAELKGMKQYNATGTVKHYCCNNQECGRYSADSVVSKRALREIYLKGYEIAVKEGGAYHIMTTYGILNGTHTASHFDLNELVLRKDWKFDGLTETDWWTMINEEGSESSKQYTSFMIRGSNDIYMVTTSSERNDNGDDSEEGLKRGVYTRAELQRNVKHILSAAMKTIAFERVLGIEDEWTVTNIPEYRGEQEIVNLSVEVEDEAFIDSSKIVTKKNTINRISITLKQRGKFLLCMEVAADESCDELAQIPLTVSFHGTPRAVISRVGSDHEFREEVVDLEAGMSIEVYLSLFFRQEGLKLRNVRIVRKES